MDNDVDVIPSGRLSLMTEQKIGGVVTFSWGGAEVEYRWLNLEVTDIKNPRASTSI